MLFVCDLSSIDDDACTACIWVCLGMQELAN